MIFSHASRKEIKNASRNVRQVEGFVFNLRFIAVKGTPFIVLLHVDIVMKILCIV